MTRLSGKSLDNLNAHFSQGDSEDLKVRRQHCEKALLIHTRIPDRLATAGRD